MKAKLFQHFIVICLLGVFSAEIWAGCSSYIGLATINEFSKEKSKAGTDPDDYVEVKLLDTNIPTTTTDNWTYTVCETFDGCFSANLSAFSQSANSKYFTYSGPDFSSLVRFDRFFDVALRDANGDLIDYFTWDSEDPNWSGSATNLTDVSSCSGNLYDYQMNDSDFSSSKASTRQIDRQPDGTGDWELTSGQSAGQSEQTSNDDPPVPGAPTIDTLADVVTLNVESTTPGPYATESVIFTVTLSAPYDVSLGLIQFDYQTIDNTAVAGQNYTAVSGTAIFTEDPGNPGFSVTSVDITIPRLETSNDNSGLFYLFIDNPLVLLGGVSQGTAEIVDPIGIATILATSSSQWLVNQNDQWNDTGPNAAHGTAVGDTQIIQLSQECNYGNFDGAGDYVEVADIDDLDIDRAFTMSLWIRPREVGVNQTLISKGVDSAINYRVGLNSSDQIVFEWGGAAELVTTTTAALNTWTHIAVVYQSGRQRVYIDGALDSVELYDPYAIGLNINARPLLFGAEETTAGVLAQYYDGDIDDIRFFDFVLPESAILDISNETPSCVNPPSLNNFDVQTDQFGIFCVDQTVTVRAIDTDGILMDGTNGSPPLPVDPDKLPNYFYETIFLDTRTNSGEWSLVAGNGAFSNLGNGQATYTFIGSALTPGTNDGGVAQFSLDYSEGLQEKLDLRVSLDSSRTFSLGTVEFQTAYAPTGFLFSENQISASPGYPGSDVAISSVPSQVAGTDFNVWVTAYGEGGAPSGGNSPAGCGIIEGYDGVKSMHLWSDYDDPSTGTIQVDINGTTIPDTECATETDCKNNPSGNLFDLTFTGGELLLANVNYMDVGRISLNIHDYDPHGTPDPGTDTTNPTTETELVSGGTQFVVIPHTFTIEAMTVADSANPGVTDDPSGKFVKAGEEFKVKVTARAVGNTITPNYGKETVPETVELDILNVEYPATGDAGNLVNAGQTYFYRTADGVLTSGANSGPHVYWDNVGSIGIAASVGDDSYLGAGDVGINAGTILTSETVGRFYLDRFELQGNSVSNTCTAGDFTYMDHAAIPVNYTLHALTVRDSIASNYDLTKGYGADDGGTAASPDLDLLAPITVHAENEDDASDRFSRMTVATGAWVEGVYAVTDSAAVFTRISDAVADVDGPYSSLQMSVSLSDGDDAAILGLDQSATAAGCGLGCESIAIGTPLNVRYGRATLDPAYGPETEPLRVPIRMQYYDGTDFILNADDSCTRYDNVSFTNITLDNPTLNIVAADIAPGGDLTVFQPSTPTLFSAGESLKWPLADTVYLELAPDEDWTLETPIGGTVDMEIEVPAWLRYDWFDSSGSKDIDDPGVLDGIADSPKTRVTFGLYRGHDRIIYWEEVR